MVAKMMRKALVWLRKLVCGEPRVFAKLETISYGMDWFGKVFRVYGVSHPFDAMKVAGIPKYGSEFGESEVEKRFVCRNVIADAIPSGAAFRVECRFYEKQ